MGKRYYFDAITGDMTEVEEIPRPSDRDEEREREQSERDTRHGHHPGGQYL